MTRPRLLDLFCGAGGAAMGYHRAGFEVTGVDINPQSRYPFDFFPRDAMTVLETGCVGHNTWLMDFDAIHASPPCQAYTIGGRAAKDGRHPKLIAPVRALLDRTGLPYVIENVPGAPLRADVVLCGSMFALPLRRHRWFETNAAIPPWTPGCNHSGRVVGVYGHPHGQAGAWPGMLPSTHATWSEAMGIDWMTTHELAEAIPPAYTEWIGRGLVEALRLAA